MNLNPANYSSISFPLLGIEVNPPRSFSIGPMTIHLYGVVIALGLLLAGIYCCRRSKRAGLTEDDILDGILWITPFAVLCARAYYCAFSWQDYAADPVSVLYIWNGGLAIYGAVLGAALGVVVYCKIKKCSLPALLDLVVMGFLIGQIMGRWGNFFNREAFGAATDAFSRMGLYNTVTGQWEYYHPTFLYESLWNLCGFTALHFLAPKRKYDGQMALGYVAWYGAGRTIIEGLRVDSLYWGSFRVSQLLAGISCTIAAALLLVLALRPHDPEKLTERKYNTLPEEQAAPEEAPENTQGDET